MVFIEVPAIGLSKNKACDYVACPSTIMSAAAMNNEDPSGSRPSAGSANRYVRMAVVQLDYHPAFRKTDSSENPLEDPSGKLDDQGSSLLPRGKAAADPAIQKEFKELRRKIRRVYTEQLWLRVEAVLKACQDKGVHLIVFPEYSIPAELLERLAKAAGNLVVVAGSHSVERAAIDQKIYERLGGEQRKDLLGKSVSPILYQGKLLALVPKLHPAEPELGQIRPGDDWTPVSLPEPLPGPMAVMICLDFLARQTEKHQELVARPFENCRFVAAPALTKTHAEDDLFRAKALEDARGYRRPVLFANIASMGRSTIYVSDKLPGDNRRFPEQVGLLEAGEEGVIIADVDLGVERAGRSTPYEQVLPLKPVAVASLVYRGIELDYAAWLDGLREKLNEEGPDEYDKLVAIAEYVGLKKPPLPKGKEDRARRRRLERLTQDIEDESSLERVRQLTVELELEEKILPLHVVRAALSGGAARAIDHWVRELGQGEFGPVRDRLKEVWSKLERERASYSVGARTAAEAVLKAVAGENFGDQSERILHVAKVFENAVLEGFEEDNAKAGQCFDQGRYEEARDIFRAMGEKAEELSRKIEPNADPIPLRRWAALCKLNTASSLLNLQEVDECRALLLAIDPALLPPLARSVLANDLHAVGEQALALKILPKEEEFTTEEERRLHAEILQGFRIGDGFIPEQIPDSANLHGMVAAERLRKNDLAGAAEHALWILGRESNAVIHAGAARILAIALFHTMDETPPDALLIPIERRGDVLEALEKAFEHLNQQHLPPKTRAQLIEVEKEFKHRIGEPDESKAIAVGAALLQSSSGRWSENQQLFLRLAQEGRVEEALALIPEDQHPWRGRLNRVNVYVAAYSAERPGMLSKAQEELLALASDFPKRPMIETPLSQTLHHVGRFEEALEHARLAFESLPCMKNRARVAEMELRCGNAPKAWELLRDYRGKIENDPYPLAIYANAAEQVGEYVEAEAALRRGAQLRPENELTRLHLARILHLYLHRFEEAADLAWQVFQEQGDRLELDLLVACAQPQRLPGPLTQEQIRRIKAIMAKLVERFRQSPKAHQWLLHFRAIVGEMLDDLGPPNMALLVDHGLAYVGHGVESLMEFIKQQRLRENVVNTLHRQGLLPLVSACEFLGSRLAFTIIRILEVSGREVGHLSPPVFLTTLTPSQDLRGAKILISDVELLLLEALDLLSSLKLALGEEGRLLVFDHVSARIRRDALKLRDEARPDRVAEMDALLRRIGSLPSAELSSSGPKTNKAFLHYLCEQRLLDDEQHARFEKYFSEEEEPTQEQIHGLTEGIVLSAFWVEELHKIGRLSAILDAVRGPVSLERGAVEQLRRTRDELADCVRAYALIDRLHIHLGEAWIQEVSRPSIEELPPMRAEYQHGEKLVREPLDEMLAYDHALAEHPDWLRLSAEFYLSLGLTYVEEVLPQLAWKDKDQIQALEQKRWSSRERDISIPMLARYLLRDQQKELDRLLIKLAELGFPDALDANDILRLEQRYKELDKGEPRRILDRMEWMARSTSHKGARPARARVAIVYGEAIFRSFTRNDYTPLNRSAFVTTLLERMETLGDLTRSDTLDSMMEFVVTLMRGDWQTLWKTKERYVVADWDSPLGRLWREISQWYEKSALRKAAMGRAFRALWRGLFEEMDEESNDFFRIALAVLHPPPIQEGIDHPEQELSLMDPANEALAILSALWPESSRKHYREEDILQAGVQARPEAIELRFNEREATFKLTFADLPGRRLIRVPPEALLLRVSPEYRSILAKHLKVRQGIHDGLAYQGLEKIEQNPSDRQALEAYAKHAVTAPFRLVRDDPSYLHRWHEALFVHSKDPQTLEELYQTLSEPFGKLPEDQTMIDILIDRYLHGEWSAREDKDRLLNEASKIPGTVAAILGLGVRAENAPTPSGIEMALQGLDRPDDRPIGSIVADMIFLRRSAMLLPTIRLTQGEVNLGDVLPAYFVRLLDSVYEPPKPDTMAEHEAALLRVCAEVVLRLAGSRPLPLRDGIWITHRLFQWLCLQLDSIPADHRLIGIQKLVQGAPSPRNEGVQDRLDPLGFGREHFDHRLAAVLHALGTMDGLMALKQENESSPSIRSVSSPKLEDRLMELAQRDAPPSTLDSKLDWHAPDNIPDLALRALLRVNSRRFAELSAESRIRRLERLPKNTRELGGNLSEFTALLMAASAQYAGFLSQDERRLLENKLRSMDEEPVTLQWRWWIFVALFVVGAHHLEQEAMNLILSHLDNVRAPEIAGIFLMGIANHNPDRIQETVDRWMAEAQRRSIDVVPVVIGALGRLRIHGDGALKKIAGDLLRALAKRPPFHDDTRMHELLASFGLRLRDS